jgi:hypothetical protein
MLRNLKARQIELTTLLFCLAVSSFFWPFAQDDYGSFMGNLASGQFCDFSLVDWYFLGYTGFNYFYRALHTIIPDVNWLGLGTYSMSVVGFYICLRVLTNCIKPIAPKFIVWLLNLFFGLFYLDSLVSISHTRASLIMCGGAALYLLLIPSISFKKIILLNLLFITGLLHRGESAIGILWTVGLTSILFSLPISHIRNRIAPLALYTCIFFIVVSIYWSNSASFIVKVEPEIEYEFMSGNIVNLDSRKTEMDSAKYQLATYGIWIDPDNVTADYMRTLIIDSPFSTKKFSRGLETMRAYLLFYPVSFLVGILIIGLLFLKSKSIQSAIKLSVYVMLCLIPMLYLAYKGLLSERHFFPLLFILELVSFIYFIHKWNAQTPNSIYFKGICTLALVLTAVTTYDTIGNYRSRNAIAASQVACSEQAMNQFEKIFSNKTVVLTIGSFHIMDHDFSFWTKNYTGNNYVMFDLFNYSLVPRYIDYQSRLCKCDATHPENFLAWLSHQNALYLGEDERLKITSAYMKSVYRKDLQFLPVEKFSFDACIENHYSYLRSTHVRQVQMQNM